MTGIESAATVEDLCRLGAAHMRRLTGFDRTLVYQFDPGWNGIVVAEDGNGLLPSYLDLRFPESDIPAQARELYRRNRVRLIADNNYTPTPLMRAEDHREAPPTDLSLAVLRSVSPCIFSTCATWGPGRRCRCHWYMRAVMGPGVLPHRAATPPALPRAYRLRVHGPDPVAADCTEGARARD